jgi:hypothetical protein
MRVIRWQWEDPPLMNGLILGLVLVVLNFGLGVRTCGCPPFISKTPNPAAPDRGGV